MNMPKGHTNNPNGRPTKGNEKRKAVSFRLQPETAAFIKQWAANLCCSQSDLVEDWIEGMRNP
jgi:hypothetical protein